jgi:branched-chain amino acid transport system permease protein/neutral amino acid transport system permease protein
MIDLVQLVVFGIVLGSIITLGAIGVSLIFGILRFAHFAHGDMMTIGAYFALVFIANAGWPIYGALFAAIIGTAVLAVALDQIVYRHLRRTAPIIMLISTLGMSLVFRSAAQLIWGTKNQVYAAGIDIPYDFMGVRISPNHLVIVAGAVLLVIVFHVFFRYSKMGKAMRAMSDNEDLARVSGIDSEKVILWAWIIGGGLAAAAGVFLALDTRLNPQLGRNLILPLFAATILGGIGKPYGAIAGGMVIGIATELSTAFIEPAYKPAVAFAIMVLVLVHRPSGIFGGQK